MFSIRIESGNSRPTTQDQLVLKNAFAFGEYRIARMTTPQKTDDQPLIAPFPTWVTPTQKPPAIESRDTMATINRERPLLLESPLATAGRSLDRPAR